MSLPACWAIKAPGTPRFDQRRQPLQTHGLQRRQQHAFIAQGRQIHVEVPNRANVVIEQELVHGLERELMRPEHLIQRADLATDDPLAYLFLEFDVARVGEDRRRLEFIPTLLLFQVDLQVVVLGSCGHFRFRGRTWRGHLGQLGGLQFFDLYLHLGSERRRLRRQLSERGNGEGD